MITNKDIRVENGNIVINGDKYPLDGQSPAAIMQIVEDNSDTTPTENSTAPVQSGGVFTALADKLTIVEKKTTKTGDSVTFDTTISSDTIYLVTMSASTTATGRRLRLSMINCVGGNTNEEYIGSQYYTLTVTNGKLTITGSTLAYGIEAILIKL